MIKQKLFLKKRVNLTDKTLNGADDIFIDPAGNINILKHVNNVDYSTMKGSKTDNVTILPSSKKNIDKVTRFYGKPRKNKLDFKTYDVVKKEPKKKQYTDVDKFEYYGNLLTNKKLSKEKRAKAETRFLELKHCSPQVNDYMTKKFGKNWKK